MADTEQKKIKLEDEYKPSDYEVEQVAKTYQNFFEYRNERNGSHLHFQNETFEEYLKKSRLLFWNSIITESEDLRSLDLEFALPFIRKEVLDFLGRITSMGIAPQITGDGLGQYGVKVLQAMYKKWRLKSKDKVEKFWETLYGIVNGTVCMYIGFDGKESSKRYLRQYDPETGKYSIEDKKVRMWNDVTTEIVPLEDMYLAKMWERNIQKQGKVIRKQDMSWDEFKAQFGHYKKSEHVFPGSRLDESSLYFEMLDTAGVIASDGVQVLRETDTDNDTHKIIANGILLNGLGEGNKTTACSPIPFDHKSQPYVWALHEPIDEKFAYGLSMPFKLQDPHKILNTSYTMLLERELRLIDPPIITSDFEAPSLIFGQKKVIPVTDVNAYKEFSLNEATGSFFTMMNSLQGVMTSQAQGGMNQIIPSRQPKSAREVVAVQNLMQQSLGNALILYYDLVYQELFLVLKTALQFYQNGKYEEKDLIKTITVPNFPISRGGVGQLEVRIVKKPQDALKLHFEAVQKSIDNGKTTEIIEVPVDVLNNLEFFIDDIKLKPENSDDMERAMYFQNVLQPILSVFAPAGLADMGKTFLRFLEINNEHPADYVSNDQLSQFISQVGIPKVNLQQMGGSNGASGNLMQSMRGMQFGGQSNGGYGQGLEPNQ